MNAEIEKIIKGLFISPEDVPLDCIKIDHYSWSEKSIYRYFEKDKINKQLMKWIEIACENEFLRWDNADSIRFVTEGFGIMRLDGDIPPCNDWCDKKEFELAAVKTLKQLVKQNIGCEITEVVHKAKALLQEYKDNTDDKTVQIYERILYELNECSLREFDELKAAIKKCGNE